MTVGQLTLVLVGGVVIVGVIGALVRARRRAEPGDDGDDGQSRSARPSAAPPAAVRSGPASEPPEQRSARLQTMQLLQGLSLGAAISPPAGTSPLDEGTATIRATLADIADRPSYAPRRPLLLPKLMQAMHDEDVSRRELGRIIASDPALAGSLLRLANSPFYRIQPEPVESLDRAVALLGLEGMRSLISAALLQPVFRISGGMFQHFGEITWEHTLYSAGAAEAHAAVLENSDPFAAQLLALIMGLGTIIVFRVATDDFLSRHQRPNPSVLAALIDTETRGVARRIAASWELSERMDGALADQQAADSDAGAPEPVSSLGRSLLIGRFLGALALLHARGLMGDEDVQAALRGCGTRADAYGRIWSRLRSLPAPL